MQQFQVQGSDIGDLKRFIGNVQIRGAAGLVLAVSTGDNAIALLEQQGMRALAKADLVRTVSLWNPVKQRAALNAFEKAVVQKDLSTGLGQRLGEFLAEDGFRTGKSAAIDKEKAGTDAAEIAAGETSDTSASDQ